MKEIIKNQAEIIKQQADMIAEMAAEMETLRQRIMELEEPKVEEPKVEEKVEEPKVEEEKEYTIDDAINEYGLLAVFSEIVWEQCSGEVTEVDGKYVVIRKASFYERSLYQKVFSRDEAEAIVRRGEMTWEDTDGFERIKEAV